MEETTLVGGDVVADEIMEAYNQALDEITHENCGNVEVDNAGDNDDDDGGFSGEDGDANVDDDVVDDSNRDDEEDELESGEYDHDYSGDSEECCGDDSEDISNSGNESMYSDQNQDESFVIDDADDIVKIDMFNLSNDDVSKLQFGSLEVAYNFYCWFAKMNGFGVRKDQVIRNKNRDVVQQTFLCNLAGFRQERGLTSEERQRGPKHETRCGCGAKFRVHIDIITQRWYITVFTFEHNHDMLKEKHCGLLAAHRKLTKSDRRVLHIYEDFFVSVGLIFDQFSKPPLPCKATVVFTFP